MYFGIHCACIARNWTKQCMVLQFLCQFLTWPTMYKNCSVWKYVRKTKRISCFAVKWMNMTVAIYSFSWSIVISNCVIIHVLPLQINLVHQITVCKCEKWGHLPEVGFKSRRSDILILKISAFINVCFWKCWGLPFWCVEWFIWKHGKIVMVKDRFPYGWHHAFYPYDWVWSPHSDNDFFMNIGNLLAWENSVSPLWAYNTWCYNMNHDCPETDMSVF
jgi:hypothetical protein